VGKVYKGLITIIKMEEENTTQNKFEVPITEKDVVHSSWIQEIKDKVISQVEEGTLQYSLIGLWDLCGNIEKFVKEKEKKERQRILDLIDDLKYNTTNSKRPDVNSTMLKQKIIMEQEENTTQVLEETPEEVEETTEEVEETTLEAVDEEESKLEETPEEVDEEDSEDEE